jgi:DNA-binding beta-propeller fold protein YncE
MSSARWPVVVALLLAGGGTAFGQDVRPLTGHFSSVRGVAFSPDGKTLVTSSYDSSARLWEVSSGKLLRTLSHFNWVNYSTFSPDGKLLATCGYDRMIRLYDPTNGNLLRTFGGHTSAAYGAAFSPDSKTVASVAAERNLRIWDATTLRELHNITTDNNNFNVYAVAFSPDGKTVACAGQDRIIRLYEPGSGRETQRLTGHMDQVVALAFSPDGRTLLSGSHDRTVRMWELSTGKERLSMSGHTNWVRSVAITRDGRTIASGSYDNTVRLWDALTGKELKQLNGHIGTVWGVDFAPDGKLLASGSEDRSARLWKVTEWTERPAAKGEKLAAADLAQHWADLSSDEGAKAFKAVVDLTQSPESALPYLKESLKPVRELEGDDVKKVARLIDELASDDFAVRKKAMDGLSALGMPVAPQLRAALAKTSDVDVRLRLFVVLRSMDNSALGPDQLRTIRALEVLERIGTKEALEVVRALARGVPEAHQTVEAKASLARMTRRLGKS